jgi:hypothetical protein
MLISMAISISVAIQSAISLAIPRSRRTWRSSSQSIRRSRSGVDVVVRSGYFDREM